MLVVLLHGALYIYSFINFDNDSGYLSEPREVYKLVTEHYDKELDRLVKESIAVKETELSTCFQDGATLHLQHEPNKG